MKQQTFDKIINYFTFAAHLLLSGGLFILGYIADGLGDDTSTAFLAFFLAVAIFSTSLFMLIKKTFRTYAIAIIAATLSFILWCTLVSAYDALPTMLGYLLIFVPLSLYKYSIREKID